MVDDIDSRRRRAAYRAHYRGTKEMDWLLGRFADARLQTMAAAELTVFEALLTQPDPDLQAWILDPATLEAQQFAGLIAQLRQFHRLDQVPA